MSLPTPPVKQLKDRVITAAVKHETGECLDEYAKQHNMSKSAALRFIVEFFFSDNFQNSIVSVENTDATIEGNN